MPKSFFYIALLGFVLSILAHATSFVISDIEKVFPPIWVLHFGIFVVWVPAILELKKRQKSEELTFLKMMNPLTFLKFLFKNTPGWLVIAAIVTMVYASFYMQMLAKTPSTNMIAWFSSGWIVFYVLSASILFPIPKQ